MRATNKLGLSLTLCATLLASGCGLKGGLYLPEDAARQRAESGNPDGTRGVPAEERDDKERRREPVGNGREGSVIEPPAPQSTPRASGN
jgi:predicted small lipoprotein YifL